MNEIITSYRVAPTRTISAGGMDFAYRDLGPRDGVPVVFLLHLAGPGAQADPHRNRPAGGMRMKEVVWMAQLDTVRGLVSGWPSAPTADRMLPTPNTRDMAGRLPDNELVIYPGAGHGGIFQHHEQFVDTALDFLAR